MMTFDRWRASAAGLVTAWALVACGGGGDSPAPLAGAATPEAVAPAGAPPALAAPQPGEPALTGNVAADGMTWMNYRRGQAGMPQLARNELIDRAAQGHSDYQKLNNTVSHDQVAGKPGFTGVRLGDRLLAAGYDYRNTTYAYGEVISATSNRSGFYMAEELITAIYHRFVIFEPKFKEIGTGSATNSAGYTYFTANLGAINGYGPGIGRGNLATWPADGQTRVTPNFFSDYEMPDPVPNLNEVGYPVSVHADINGVVGVQSFTIRPRGGAELATRVLKVGEDENTPRSAAAIVPIAVLKANTTYDVSFTGTLDNVAITKTWSFTTK